MTELDERKIRVLGELKTKTRSFASWQKKDRTILLQVDKTLIHFTEEEFGDFFNFLHSVLDNKDFSLDFGEHGDD